MTTLVLEHLQHADSASPDITIDSSGRVGIGTTVPDGKLTVALENSNTPAFRLSSPTSGTDFAISSYNDANGTYVSMGVNHLFNVSGNDAVMDTNDKSAAIVLDGRNNGRIQFLTNSSGIATPRMTILQDGKVGIGSTGPEAKLHVHNETGGNATDKASMLSEAVMKIQPHATNSTNMLIAQVDGGNAMGIQVTNGPATANWAIALSPFGGNVGIGTVDPQAILDIRGNTTTYGGMSKIYLTDVSNHAQSKNWAIGNGGSGFGHFTIGLSNAKDGDPMENGTHTTPLVIDETGKVALFSTTISNDAGFWAANIAEAQDSKMAFRIQPTRGSVNKGISIGAVGKNSSSSTGIQAYDTSSNTANTLELNPHGGAVTTTNQPSFAAHYNGSDWIPGDGNIMVHNSTGGAGHNTGNHYSTSTGRFTAPVAGVYHFDWYSILTGNYNNAYIQVYKNNARIYGGDAHISKTTASASGWDTYNWNRDLYMSAGDYIDMRSYGSVTFHGNYWNCFSGHLVG